MRDKRDYRVCRQGQKVKFANRVRAELEIEFRDYDPQIMNAYQCPQCGWWHIGRIRGQYLYSKESQ